MSSRFIYFSQYKPEVFLAHTPLWNLQINGYPAVMVVFNLALAALAMWVTYAVVCNLKNKKRNNLLTGLLGAVWLLVAPNAAYVMTDVRHIIGYCPVEEYGHVCAENAWMTLFFCLYGILGWLGFVYCIRPIARTCGKIWGSKASRCFVAIAIPVIAFGLLLGLVSRWNSWDIVTSPLLIFETVAYYMTSVVYITNWLAATLLLYILYAIGDRCFIDLPYEPKKR